MEGLVVCRARNNIGSALIEGLVQECGGTPPWQTLAYIGCVFTGCLAGSLEAQECISSNLEQVKLGTKDTGEVGSGSSKSALKEVRRMLGSGKYPLT